MDLAVVADDLRRWCKEAGFDDVRITEADVGEHGDRLAQWLAAGLHGGTSGDLGYLERHNDLRQNPAQLEPGTVRVISARMNYTDANDDPQAVLADPNLGYISRYALGRDYHKVLRRRLARIGKRLSAATGAKVYRAFTDSAPVLEKGLAERAGVGWIGKNTLLLTESSGSMFFLGEIFTDLPLPTDPLNAVRDSGPGCGSCRACISVCPTDAILAPYQLDARRCISYLTIENKGAIPTELRSAIGNRIFGCDDCQLFCPWNRFAVPSSEADFAARSALAAPDLLTLWAWNEAAFLKHTEGSAMRRIGYEQWQRNLAVALGNAPASPEIQNALRSGIGRVSALVDEHIRWALRRQAES